MMPEKITLKNLLKNKTNRLQTKKSLQCRDFFVYGDKQLKYSQKIYPFPNIRLYF